MSSSKFPNHYVPPRPESLTQQQLVHLCKIQQETIVRMRKKSCGHKRSIHEMQTKMRIQKGEIADLKVIRSDAIEREVHKITGTWVDAETQVVQAEESVVI